MLAVLRKKRDEHTTFIDRNHWGREKSYQAAQTELTSKPEEDEEEEDSTDQEDF